MIKSIRTILILVLFAFTVVGAFGQKPGYTRYVITKNIDRNGNVTPSRGGAGQWIKFEGNLLFADYGGGLTPERYVYDSTQDNGNKIYYRQAYNHGTMNQGSGWMTFYDTYIIVSADKNTLNKMSKNGGFVLKKQSANDVGDMIE